MGMNRLNWVKISEDWYQCEAPYDFGTIDAVRRKVYWNSRQKEFSRAEDFRDSDDLLTSSYYEFVSLPLLLDRWELYRNANWYADFDTLFDLNLHAMDLIETYIKDEKVAV